MCRILEISAPTTVACITQFCPRTKIVGPDFRGLMYRNVLFDTQHADIRLTWSRILYAFLVLSKYFNFLTP